MKSILILPLALCATTLFAKEATVAPTGTMYMIETKILSLSAGALASNDLAIISDSLTMSTNGDWSAGGKVSAAGDPLARLEKTAGVDVLSAPQIVTLAGQEATIQIVREIAYLVQETNVLYRVRRHWFSEDSVEAISNSLYRMQALASELNPGITLTITPTPTGNGTVKTDVNFRYNLLTEMTSLADSKIKMGQPLIESRKISTSVVTKPGDWVVLGGAQKVRNKVITRDTHPVLPFISVTKNADMEENIVVILRVTTVKPDDSAATKPTN